MANLLKNLFSGNFFDELSETVEDIVEAIEDFSGEDVETAAADVVDVVEDVVDSVDRFVDQNEDSLEDFTNLDLPDISDVELPSFDTPADIVKLPSAIFDFVRDLTEVELPDLTLPTLPRLDVSGLGLKRDSIDLNLDLDLNQVLVTVQDNVREVLDESEDIVDDIEELASDVVEAIDEDGEEIAEAVVEAVEGFIEEDPIDLTQNLERVFDIVDDVADGVEEAAGENTVAGIIGGVFDIVSDVAQGVEDIIGVDTGVPEVVDDVGEFTTELTAQIEEGEIATLEFLEDVVDLSAEVGDFLDDFDELADEAIADFEGLNVGVNIDIERDLLISIGDVAVEISDTIRDIGGGILLTENPFDSLATNSDEPAILSASVVASVTPTSDNPDGGSQLLASATLTLDNSLFSTEASLAL